MQPPHSRRVNLPLTMVRVSPTLMPPCICAGPPGTSFVTCPVQVLFHQLPRFAARSLTGMPSGSVLTCRLPDGEGSSTAPMPTIESPDIFPPVFSADFVLARRALPSRRSILQSWISSALSPPSLLPGVSFFSLGPKAPRLSNGARLGRASPRYSVVPETKARCTLQGALRAYVGALQGAQW